MADIIQRPLFFEGQILSSRDLSTAVDYARGRAERHDRLLHTWGIAKGLKLEAIEQQDESGTKFVEVTLQAGTAIDARGREIVLTEGRRLDTELFLESNVFVEGQQDAWFPVVLHFREEAANAVDLLGACASTGDQPTRMTESGEEEFRRPGGAVELGDADPAVLVGFVRWGGDANPRFTHVAETDGALARRYVGVRADSMEAQGGRVEMRTAEESTPGATAVHLSEEELSFGLQDGSGGLSKLFTVNRKGEVTAAGKPLGGGVRVESGMATHLMRIPLPANVTEEAVADGSVVLHVQVQMLMKAPQNFDLLVPFECYVDADRRLHCRAYMMSFTSFGLALLPHTASYTVIGFSPDPS